MKENKNTKTKPIRNNNIGLLKTGLESVEKRRKNIHQIVWGLPHLEKKITKVGLITSIYQVVVVLLAIYSISTLAVPLRDQIRHEWIFLPLELLTFFVLGIDYILKWWTNDLQRPKMTKKKALFSFPFSWIGIILFLSIVPSFYIIGYFDTANDKDYEFFADFKFLRIIRILLLAKIFKPFKLLIDSLIKNKVLFQLVFVIILVTIIISALVIYNTEYVYKVDNDQKILDNQVKTFWDALYMSAITLTTIGYGDFVPHTSAGKILVVILSIIGVAIFSIPSGIIAGGFIAEAQETKSNRELKALKKQEKAIAKLSAEVKQETEIAHDIKEEMDSIHGKDTDQEAKINEKSDK